MSTARTAYPSMAELSKPGSGTSVVTFSASSRPCESSRGNSIGSMEPMPSSTVVQMLVDRPETVVVSHWIGLLAGCRWVPVLR